MRQLLSIASLLFFLIPGSLSAQAARPDQAAPAPGQAREPKFSVHVFPNPTPGPLVLQTNPIDAAVLVTVSTADGVPVFTAENYCRRTSAPLDLSHLPAGTYRLEVQWRGSIRRTALEKTGGSATSALPLTAPTSY